MTNPARVIDTWFYSVIDESAGEWVVLRLKDGKTWDRLCSFPDLRSAQEEPKP